MADTYSDNRVVSIDRRKQLKRQRRSQFWQATWRTSTILGCTLGLGWLFKSPGWQVQKANQIKVLGNRHLTTQTLETFIPLTFPTSLLRVKPMDIKTMLEQNTHVDRVTVRRQLFPPRILVQVHERPPVAIATCRSCLLVGKKNSAAQPITVGPADLWLLDDRGIPLPFESYPKLGQTDKAPELVVSSYLKPLDAKQAKAVSLKNIPAQTNLVFLDPKRQKEWQNLFEPMRSSPVKIQELDWQNPNNLNLRTELGVVQIGPSSAKISEQLSALDRMRALPQTLDSKKIKYINLEDPKNPVLEVNAVPSSPQPKVMP
ncbi:cell division protein FtsQ/DivIB [Altericista sp. CCNU0014]|uniref:cell division protein FtsQ/DivIB n=1 Tax=Altericista sp. CCNU0014 TaxID=3082949 RepID=UPI0038517622